MNKIYLDNKKISIIFIVSLIFISFTQLRLFNLPIGFGEIGLLFLGFLAIKKIYLFNKINIIKYLYDDIFVKYFIIFIFILISAYIYNILVNNHKTDTNLIHDILAYGFIFYLILLFKILNNYMKINFKFIMSKMILYLVIFYGFLLIFTLLYGDASGITYKYTGMSRYTGLSKNPNQLALLFTIIPFILMAFYKDNNIYFEKEYIFGLVLLSIVIGYMSHGRALLVAWMISFALIMFYHIYIKSFKNFKIIFFSIFLITFIGIFFYLNEIILILFSKGMGGLTHRIELWTNAIELIKTSPFIGFGPGAHVSSIVNVNTYWEVHNTFLDLTVQTGIIGLSCYLFLLYKIGKNLYNHGNIYLMSAFIALIIFSTFHFILRQPIFWFYLFYFYQVGHEKKCVQ